MGLKEVALAIGVAILGALFVGFAIDALYEGPKYEDFCKNTYYNYAAPEKVRAVQVVCPQDPAELMNSCSQEKGYVDHKGYDANGCPVEPFCNYCQRDYNAAQEKYNFNLLWITAPIGLILILLGLYLTVPTISAGLLFAGILTLAQVTARIFGNLGKFSRVLILGIELALLIWIGYKKVEKHRKK